MRNPQLKHLMLSDKTIFPHLLKGYHFHKGHSWNEKCCWSEVLCTILNFTCFSKNVLTMPPTTTERLFLVVIFILLRDIWNKVSMKFWVYQFIILVWFRSPSPHENFVLCEELEGLNECLSHVGGRATDNGFLPYTTVFPFIYRKWTSPKYFLNSTFKVQMIPFLECEPLEF